ncbi:hypothetical protein [Natrarchaeobaculum sulfurireducens]|uniref:Uncharacterized protein n=1 Tax=Natrarchaeobaculum sulfurireducens TaxID=2044521 RepID=A0A346PMH5_9EURY|nr:hypothetical protein [Natrarchaeobaculum sulfurireducens]AXR80720.1 hypothetical protein AArcMg_0698 [Natrarchaeobaculum sulfurireducens]
MSTGAEGDDSPTGEFTVNDDGVSPAAELTQIWGEYQEQVNDAENAAEASQVAFNMINQMSEVQAEAEDDAGVGGDSSVSAMVEGFINQLADRKSYLSRSTLKQVWNDELSAAKAAQTIEGDLPGNFKDFLEETLVSVTKTVFTDVQSDDVSYELRFDDGNDTVLSVDRSTLFNCKKFWEAYCSESGQYPARHESYGENEWDGFVGRLIEDLETVDREVGPRTAAFRAVKNHVRHATAYADLEDAVERGGVWIDDDPDEGDPTEIRVLRQDIARVTNNHEVTDRALQSEIKARGATVERLGGKVSESTHVFGNWQTYWCFDPDEVPTPDEYDEEPEDPVDRVDDALDSSDETDDDDEDDDSGETGGSESGQIGSFGVDPDEDGESDPENGGDDDGE